MSSTFPKGRTATANQGDCTCVEQSPVDNLPQRWGNLTRQSLLEQFKYFSVKNTPDIFLSYIIWIHLIFEDLNFYASLRGWHNLSRTTVKPQPFLSYRKIPRISPGAYIFQRPFLRGLHSEGLIYGLTLQLEVNFPFLLCFTLYLRAIFQVQAPGDPYIWRGDLTEGFLRYRFGGLIFEGAYTWRGLFSQFY